MTSSSLKGPGYGTCCRLISARGLSPGWAVGTVAVSLLLALIALIVLRPSVLAKNGPQQTQQITISGQFLDNSGTPLTDVAVYVSGSIRAGAVSGPDGTYSVSLPMGGSYTLTPSRNGVVFQPLDIRFNSVNANLTNANFVGTRTRTFKVSGTVLDPSGRGAVDVVIRVSDSPQVLTLTGPTGYYSFDNLTAGLSYTLRPSKTSVTFDPPSFRIPSLNRDFGPINFVEIPRDKVRISGLITDSSGQPLSDVIVGLGGAEPALATTGSGGSYAFTVPSGGNYLVAPARNGYTFTPPSLTFNNLTQTQYGNFLGAPVPTFTISGVVLDSTGAPLIDVPVAITGSGGQVIPTGPAGNYAFSVLASGSYTIAPSVPGMAFLPPSRSFANLSSNQSGVNFVGSPGMGGHDVGPTPESTASPSPSPSPSPASKATPSPEPTPSPSPKVTGKDSPKNSPEKTGEKNQTVGTAPGPLAQTAPRENQTVAQKKTRGRRIRSRRRATRRRVRAKRVLKTTLKSKAKGNARRTSR